MYPGPYSIYLKRTMVHGILSEVRAPMACQMLAALLESAQETKEDEAVQHMRCSLKTP